MGHAVKGLFSLMMGRRELMADCARGAAAAARGRTCRIRRTPREDGLDRALGRSGSADSPSGAIAALEAVLADHPTTRWR